MNTLTTFAAATYSCGTYSANTYDSTEQCATTGASGVPNTGFQLLQTNYVFLAGASLVVAILIASIILVIKRLKRKQAHN